MRLGREVLSAHLRWNLATPWQWNAIELSAMERGGCEAGREVTDRCLIMEINLALISIDTEAGFLNKWTKMKPF